MLSHEESAEIEPSKMIEIGFDWGKAANTTSITQAAVGPDCGRPDVLKGAGQVGRQTRPRKSRDASSFKLKKIGSLFLKTGFVLMCLMMMGTNSILMLKKTGPLMTTRSVLVGPMMTMTGPLMMKTRGDVGVNHMMMETCSTGGHYNILRLANSALGMLFTNVPELVGGR